VQTHSDFLTQRRSQALQYLVCTRINSKIKTLFYLVPQDYLSVLKLVFSVSVAGVAASPTGTDTGPKPDYRCRALVRIPHLQ
jgi:hypothetical protein